MQRKQIPKMTHLAGFIVGSLGCYSISENFCDDLILAFFMITFKSQKIQNAGTISVIVYYKKN